ncbi:hypothetical protein EON79_15230 [bacterium]|nr:MAG: hypothetical protein EON79_15230 [bacterium]
MNLGRGELKRRSLTRKRICRRAGLVLVGILLALLLDIWLYPRFVQPSGRVVNRRENGLWLRYTWAFGVRKPEEYPALAARFERHGIRDAFFHVRNIDRYGKLVHRRPKETQALNRELKRQAPRVRRIAWIYAGNRQGQGLVDLSLPKTRRAMVAEAAGLVRELGFDGVQWDYEICNDRDPNLLLLLEETRKALPKGAFLGAAVPTWYPPPIGAVGWSAAYFGEVAKRCDSLAVMAYDSGLYSPRAYVWWVSEQVVRITRAVAEANPDCRVLMGVPTYKESTRSHRSNVETLRLALLGVRNGLASGADLSVWQGVCPFADYTTEEADWREFDRLWPKE